MLLCTAIDSERAEGLAIFFPSSGSSQGIAGIRVGKVWQSSDHQLARYQADRDTMSLPLRQLKRRAVHLSLLSPSMGNPCISTGSFTYDVSKACCCKIVATHFSKRVGASVCQVAGPLCHEQRIDDANAAQVFLFQVHLFSNALLIKQATTA